MINEKKLVSIIVPIYNNEKYLKACINSIINQTYKNIEIILVDDGSKDNCLKICKDFQKKDKRINLYSQKNGGVSSARNTGLKHIHGDYICFIDSDDTIETNYIETHVTNIQKYKADISIVSLNKNIKTKSVLFYDNYNFKENLIYNSNISSGVINKLYKKDILKSILFENYAIGEDLLFNIKVANNVNKVVFFNTHLYNYRIENINSMIHGNFKIKSFEILTILKNIAENNVDNIKLKEIISSRYPIEAAKLLIKMISSCYYDKEKYDLCYEYIKNNIKCMLKSSKISFIKKIIVIIIYNFRRLYTEKKVKNSKFMYIIFNKLKELIG